MSTRRARLALGHLATSAVVGGAGFVGAVGAWWRPVGLVTLVAGVVAAAGWYLGTRDASSQLSGLAAVLDGRTWHDLEPVAGSAA